SIHAHQIVDSPERPAGVKELKRYLAYAEHGPAVLLGQTAEGDAPDGRPATSPFESAVQAALSAALKRSSGMDNLAVVPCVGVGAQPVGLAVRDEAGRYVLGIECDGLTYRDLPTARDRDRLRQEVLGQLGWPLHRVWSPAWIVSQREEEQRLLAAVERGRQLRDGLILDDETPLSVLKPEDQPKARGRTRPDQIMSTPYVPPSRPTGVEAAIHAPSPQPPPPCEGEGEEPASALTPVTAQARPIDQVDEAEIADAIRVVLQRELAMPQDALIVAAARELGYRRTGVLIRTRIVNTMTELLEQRVLAEVGGNLRLAPDDHGSAQIG
ncbi:MAG: hypothetical protein AB7K36_27510, partial [Chloroflexota bacterium]